MAQRYAASVRETRIVALLRAPVARIVAGIGVIALAGCVEPVESMGLQPVVTDALHLERMFAHYPADMLGAYRADMSGSAAWADSVLETLSLSEKAAQLVVADFGRADGQTVPRATMRAVADLGVGGVLLPRVMDPLDVRSVVESLQQSAPIPLLIAADFERGAGRFSSNLTELPSNMAIGATGDTTYASAAGRLTAIESRALGVNLLFAPVADVNSDPRNPIINTRAYGDQPDDVAAHAIAFSDEAERWGLLTTFKHFPGHGDTATDTHTALATVPGTRDELDAEGLWPFAAASRRAAPPAAFMTAHVWVPALDREPLPATFSRHVLHDILRGQMGYDGLVVTDDIRMGALSAAYSLDERVVNPIAAGADVVLTPEDAAAAVTAIVRAVQASRIPLQRLDEAVRRVLVAKGRAGLHRQRLIERPVLEMLLAEPRGQRVADSIAVAALTWVPPVDAIADDETVSDAALRTVIARDVAARIDSTRRLVLLHLANYQASESIVAAMDSLEARVQPTKSFRSMPDVTDAERLRLQRALGEEQDVLVVLYMRLQSGRGAAGLFEGHRKLLSALLSSARQPDSGKSLTIIMLGDPYTAATLPGGVEVLLGYDQSVATIHAIADVLHGRAAVRGRLPVRLFADGDSSR